MWDKAIPYLYLEDGVHAAKYSDELVLISLYGFFCCIASVSEWGDQLVCNIIFEMWKIHYLIALILV